MRGASRGVMNDFIDPQHTLSLLKIMPILSLALADDPGDSSSSSSDHSVLDELDLGIS